MSNGKKRSSNSTNLYVKNFGKDFNETKLCQLFSAFGTITSCKIPTGSNGESRGFGYVNFERSEMAREAMEHLNGHPLEQNKHLYVAFFQTKSEREKELRRVHEENRERRSHQLCLYVSNLDTMIDEKQLENIFSKFGTITKTHILRKNTQSKGTGFVCFGSTEEARRAMDEMNGQWIGSKPIYVKFSNGDSEPQMDTSTDSSIQSYKPPQPIAPLILPHPNYPTVVYVPTVLVPPSLNTFPLLMTQAPFPIQPSPPPATIVPANTKNRATPTAKAKHSIYPYVSVRSDD
ncbi:unnamed protein product [Adineta ricciae]|uniref:RRM domain-containing protein n=1 Tax=Adineta ricciae TaxID=249248 RepID=A0A814LUK5_ADIRI|nr:unnamed protein product [Adineta ricciae]